MEAVVAEVSAHELVAQRLRARRQAQALDASKLVPFEHEASGETFLAGPLSYDLHRKWMGIKRFEDIQHQKANKTFEDAVERTQSDRFLLTHAVYTEDGKPLGGELAELLQEMEGFGPDTYRLLSEAEKANPPREELAREITHLMRAVTGNIVLWQTLFESGMGKVLIDFMSTHSTEEERAHAAREIAKAEECIETFGAFFDARHWAHEMGFEPKSEGLSRADLEAAAASLQ